ncbi:MAG: hypothetical protein ACI4PV_01130, partial [Butyricicoccus sp.]
LTKKQAACQFVHSHRFFVKFHVFLYVLLKTLSAICEIYLEIIFNYSKNKYFAVPHISSAKLSGAKLKIPLRFLHPFCTPIRKKILHPTSISGQARKKINQPCSAFSCSKH